MVRKNCNYLIARVVSANSKSDSITIELLSKELNKLEVEVVSDELDFLEEEILRLENKIKEKEVEMEFFRKMLVCVIETKEWIKEEIGRRCDRFKLWYENAEIKEKSYYYGLYKAMEELSQDIYERECRW